MTTPIERLLERETTPDAGEVLASLLSTIDQIAEKHGRKTLTLGVGDMYARRLALCMALEAFKNDPEECSIFEALLWDNSLITRDEDDVMIHGDNLRDSANAIADRFDTYVEAAA